MTSLPALGSQLLAREKAAPPAVIPTGCSTLDEVLQDGFQYGEISSLSGPEQTGKSLISMNATANHLLRNEAAEVCIVDTTGSFSPLVLRDVLRERSRTLVHTDDCHSKQTVSDEQIVLVLERVKIMRAFDLEGVKESIGELFEMWRSRRHLETAVDKPNIRSTEIKSSQDEDEEIDWEDERQGLLIANLPQTSATNTSPKMLIIDQVSNVVNRELSKNHVQGQAEYLDFRLRLRRLCRECKVCTILINQAVKPSAENTQHHYELPVSMSADKPTSWIPGLGRAYSQNIDLSVLLVPTRSPTRPSTAREIRDGSDIVFKVLFDRFGPRTGREAAFTVKRHSLLAVP